MFIKNFCKFSDISDINKKKLFHPWVRMMKSVIKAISEKEISAEGKSKSIEESDRKKLMNRQKCLNELKTVLEQALKNSNTIFEH
jgi:hypothetical protein